MAKLMKENFQKMLSLDGCGVAEECLILQPKPDLDGTKGFCTKFVCQRAHISGSPLRMANPSVYLIDKCCELHVSWL